jgi:hypothetical protein
VSRLGPRRQVRTVPPFHFLHIQRTPPLVATCTHPTQQQSAAGPRLLVLSHLPPAFVQPIQSIVPSLARCLLNFTPALHNMSSSYASPNRVRTAASPPGPRSAGRGPGSPAGAPKSPVPGGGRASDWARDGSAADQATSAAASAGTRTPFISMPGSPALLGGEDGSPTDHKPILAERFKTKMCRNYVEKGECPYEIRCMFAHGDDEMRTKQMNLTDGLTTEEAIKTFQRAQAEKNRKSAKKSQKRQLQKVTKEGGVGSPTGASPAVGATNPTSGAAGASGLLGVGGPSVPLPATRSSPAGPAGSRNFGGAPTSPAASFEEGGPAGKSKGGGTPSSLPQPRHKQQQAAFEEEKRRLAQKRGGGDTEPNTPTGGSRGQSTPQEESGGWTVEAGDGSPSTTAAVCGGRAGMGSELRGGSGQRLSTGSNADRADGNGQGGSFASAADSSTSAAGGGGGVAGSTSVPAAGGTTTTTTTTATGPLLPRGTASASTSFEALAGVVDNRRQLAAAGAVNAPTPGEDHLLGGGGAAPGLKLWGSEAGTPSSRPTPGDASSVNSLFAPGTALLQLGGTPANTVANSSAANTARTVSDDDEGEELLGLISAIRGSSSAGHTESSG